MRALVLSDIHANLEALSAVLDHASAPRPLFDTVWNLGDTVGYGASPNQVIDRVRPLSSLTVRGNHDRVCCGLSSPANFNPIARAAVEWTRSELTPPSLDWLRSLPQGPLHPRPVQTKAEPVQVLLLAGSALASDPVAPFTSDPDLDPRTALVDASPLPPAAAVTCAHGSPIHEDHYIVTLRDALDPLRQTASSVTFVGHTHLQGGFALLITPEATSPSQTGSWQELRPHFGSRSRAESWAFPLQPGFRYLLNPGSVGQPRDGDWRAAFAIYDDQAAQITFHRVPYDVTAAQGRILMAGLPERLAARLRDGR